MKIEIKNRWNGCSMIATIWTQEGCGACEKEKTLLVANGYEIEERPAERADGKHMQDVLDVEAFAHLENHGGKLPVKCINGVFSN